MRKKRKKITSKPFSREEEEALIASFTKQNGTTYWEVEPIPLPKIKSKKGKKRETPERRFLVEKIPTYLEDYFMYSKTKYKTKYKTESKTKSKTEVGSLLVYTLPLTNCSPVAEICERVAFASTVLAEEPNGSKIRHKIVYLNMGEKRLAVGMYAANTHQLEVLVTHFENQDFEQVEFPTCVAAALHKVIMTQRNFEFGPYEQNVLLESEITALKAAYKGLEATLF